MYANANRQQTTSTQTWIRKQGKYTPSLLVYVTILHVAEMIDNNPTCSRGHGQPQMAEGAQPPGFTYLKSDLHKVTSTLKTKKHALRTIQAEQPCAETGWSNIRVDPQSMKQAELCDQSRYPCKYNIRFPAGPSSTLHTIRGKG